MRRAEMARRRKNLSEKRNEEEKVRLICPPLTSQDPTRKFPYCHFPEPPFTSHFPLLS